MTVLVTGVAGFIGMHVAEALLARGDQVIGLDNLNSYYDPALKAARLARLEGRAGFVFVKADVSDRDAMNSLAEAHPEITGVVHLAAQAGVRYSLEDPYSYVQSNVMGQVVLVEAMRRLPRLNHFVYASSSSVYGANKKVPFSVDDRADSPLSVYAATKKADELLLHAYCHLYRLPATGLRFFTVYGPWGRPDMAPYLFTSAVFDGRPLKLFNQGKMHRDFTYIDDIVAGVIAALDHPPADDGARPPHRVYNLGNSRSEPLRDFLAAIEAAVGRAAIVELHDMQPGDVVETFADISATTRDLGYEPKVAIGEGIPRFVDWYRAYKAAR
ncbi:SDR family NAD(P)-dependent oxidoreductase [Lacibacterium aquatile]|uniref:SDR family NAD(P)-dependent oxidoreductase n=1 Tax=Lacibacterium aquatile TaxID=1168082 RepID=A0ABW5DNK1_9PROT